MTAGDLSSPVFDFTSLDYESVQTDLVRYAQATFPAELWTDFNDSNMGTFLLQLKAYITDLLSYNLNAVINECIIANVVREQNFRNIAKSFDYEMPTATPSSTTLRLTLDASGTYPFTITPRLRFSTPDGIIFQPDGFTSVASYPGSGYVDVDATAGDEHYLEDFGTSTGQPGQTFRLSGNPLIDGTLSVIFGATSYTKVSNFVDAGPTDKVYRIETTDEGVSTIILGDGVNGYIPPLGTVGYATYKTGGGSDTNLPIGTVTSTSGTSDGSTFPTQIVSVTNTVAATGGGPKQTLASAKAALPKALKANDRAVTVEDYASIATTVGGVFKAAAIPGKATGGSIPVYLFVVPSGGGNPSDALKNSIIVGLKPKKMAGKRVRVFNPLYVYLAIEGDVYIQNNAVASIVSNRVKTVFRNKYGLDSEEAEFGTLLELQNAYDYVKSDTVDGVNRFFYRQFTVLPYMSRYPTIPTTGNGSAENITINSSLVKRREWHVEVLAPSAPVLCSRFQVKQRQLGTITFVSDTLLTDEQGNYDVDSLLGWTLRPLPTEDATVTFAIAGNTRSSITVSGGLLAVAEPDDSYVLERTESRIGKILSTTTTASVSGSTTVPVADVTSWQAGDPVLVNGYETTVASVGVGQLVLSSAITCGNGATVRYRWVSDDTSLSFTVTNGSTPFAAGDVFFVDTYPNTGDLQLRPEAFPLLDDSNVVVNEIGGVK